jgi:hypothetical protein
MMHEKKPPPRAIRPPVNVVNKFIPIRPPKS